ncbi:bifunctional proline dehydrogenase/L-glutamate gamma-semialdehyde dehydrogenase PutA [Microbaculum marinisediminis]|uniref:Bifunctional protein PutA n=1 Tax=Microbaculum marinisediminis TaxID=2931392 RepID=A0AAW5QSV4_9HYPH|nr:bifunctional proline dehydrogenase/L-glutamate gamma-semialdehyde dehydrogenase PutA [Microbaculum sp. A6E488]MCT8970743.1 bifunctional proline dehydrogenase/L-glutamate gamma-semialdehyde dehydrogenase PutA [Microbaculum sp. A6E488]
MDPSPEADPAPFSAPYAAADGPLIARLLADTRLAPDAEDRVDDTARALIEGIRARTGGIGGVEDFLREYGLSTREGLALMVLAEALLRVPDAETADRLIEDKLGAADWSAHEGHGDTWLVSASTWALGLSSRIVHPGETPEGIIAGLVKRLGLPAVRTATRRAMRVLGHQFVLGETIHDALDRARSAASRGVRHSFDMLGEGARTAADAERYFDSYANAIEAIGKTAGNQPLPARPGISVKLSALHPRYEAVKRDRVMTELVPLLVDLARKARDFDLNLTVDAEEADRLELSLEVFAAALADPSLSGWDGFGLAVQAYQKRAPRVIDWVRELADAHDRRLMVRLVKGAYWDTEVKRAQERGLAGFPVFTRKPATDLCYMACAQRLLDARPRLYPQIATHNALTVATILEMAGGTDGGAANGMDGFEFQRLHGMGEALYESLAQRVPQAACRIYAPVGGHKDLLAYLVRRLLENGANSSFVSVVGDHSVPVERLLVRPAAYLGPDQPSRHPAIPLPVDLYRPDRANSRGLEFGHRETLRDLTRGVRAIAFPAPEARPLVDGKAVDGTARDVKSPADGKAVVGNVHEASAETADRAIEAAAKGFESWSRTPVEDRARVLDRIADLYEARQDTLLAVIAAEGGRTLVDGLAEVREAVDFCRYYAAQARTLFLDKTMPGPTGEENRYRHRGRGVFVCISPWNFPLAIFTGQIVAALVSGNAVVAKPAEQTPLVAALAVGLMHEAGVPGAALQLVPGDGAVGARLVAHPRVAGVAFTGSTETAWRINRTLAAKDGPIVPLIAETGGINAMIVDATALPEQVADDVVMSAFRSAGQRCSALRLLLLQEDVADRMIEMIVGAAKELRLGDPADPAVDIGPVIDAEARDRLRAHVARMEKEQRVRFAGTVPGGDLGDGTWFAPHVVELKSPRDLTEEIFGPVLHVARWKAKDLGRTLDDVAASGYGLTLGVHSRIDAFHRQVVDRLPVGNVYVNRNMIGAVVGTQPFGGSGLSGTGPKAGGPDYLARFAQEQVVSINTAAAGGNASLIAISDDRG